MSSWRLPEGSLAECWCWQAVLSAAAPSAPVPPGCCPQLDDVVDGKQRITSLHAFNTGHFPNGDEFRLQVRPGLPAVGRLRASTAPAVLGAAITSAR